MIFINIFVGTQWKLILTCEKFMKRSYNSDMLTQSDLEHRQRNKPSIDYLNYLNNPNRNQIIILDYL